MDNPIWFVALALVMAVAVILPQRKDILSWWSEVQLALVADEDDMDLDDSDCWSLFATNADPSEWDDYDGG